MISEAAARQRAAVEVVQGRAVGAARARLRRLDRRRPLASWREQSAGFLAVVSGLQVEAALSGGIYSAAVLAEQDAYVAPESFTDPATFSGFASDGRPLGSLLEVPVERLETALGDGMSWSAAVKQASSSMSMLLLTQIADVSRQAAGVDIAMRPGVGYVRMVRAGGCARCAILAGRFYRWNDGFLRHPRCNCRHVATHVGDRAEAIANGLIDDPYEAFRGLDASEQDRIYTKAGAQAIRDGADMSQVVNSRRGMSPNGWFTTEGRTRRGNASALLKPRQRRMTPEGIYAQSKGDQVMARELLERHGYVLPKGQVSSGALRGQREGFGQMGGGGRRKAASAAVSEARRTGVRDPMNRYTMTAAERRLYDAERDYAMALRGQSPYTPDRGNNRPDPRGARPFAEFRVATPQELATAEARYRRLLATGGEKFV